MKVFSLYYKDNFVAAFSNREEAVSYGKMHYAQESWDCNIVIEYISKSPFSSPFNPLPNTHPYPISPITRTPDKVKYPLEPKIWCGNVDSLGKVPQRY